MNRDFVHRSGSGRVGDLSVEGRARHDAHVAAHLRVVLDVVVEVAGLQALDATVAVDGRDRVARDAHHGSGGLGQVGGPLGHGDQREGVLGRVVTLLVPGHVGRDQVGIAVLADGREDHGRRVTHGEADLHDLAAVELVLVPGRDGGGLEVIDDLIDVQGGDVAGPVLRGDEGVVLRGRKAHVAVQDLVDDLEGVLGTPLAGDEYAVRGRAPDQEHDVGLDLRAEDLATLEERVEQLAERLGHDAVGVEALVEGGDVHAVVHRRDHVAIGVLADRQLRRLLLGQRDAGAGEKHEMHLAGGVDADHRDLGRVEAQQIHERVQRLGEDLVGAGDAHRAELGRLVAVVLLLVRLAEGVSAGLNARDEAGERQKDRVKLAHWSVLPEPFAQNGRLCTPAIRLAGSARTHFGQDERKCTCYLKSCQGFVWKI